MTPFFQPFLPIWHLTVWPLMLRHHQYFSKTSCICLLFTYGSFITLGYSHIEIKLKMYLLFSWPVPLDIWPMTSPVRWTVHLIPGHLPTKFWGSSNVASRRRSWHSFFLHVHKRALGQPLTSRTLISNLDPCHLYTMRYLHIRTTVSPSFGCIPEGVWGGLPLSIIFGDLHHSMEYNFYSPYTTYRDEIMMWEPSSV